MLNIHNNNIIHRITPDGFMLFYRTILLIVIIFSCLMNSVTGQSNQVSFGKITVEDGLSQNSVISITQDNLGALWLVTQDGLNRYDGQNFEKFNEYFDDITKPDFSRLGKVFVDQDDQIWLITKTGSLKRYTPYTFQSQTSPSIQNANCSSGKTL